MGDVAVDQLYRLHLVTVLLLAYRDRDVLPHLVGWATLGGAEPVRGFCIENVALLAYVPEAVILPRRNCRECALACPNYCSRNAVFHR
jgi:hypothetical protein